MHATALAHMQMCVDVHLRRDRHYRIVDLGSRRAQPKHPTHRSVLDGYDFDYIGIDILAGANVDRVMTKPYRIPVRSNTVDVAMSGQAFEHIPFPWVTFLEMARILKPGGLIFLVAPSRGQRHGTQDAWRYYPDSMRSFAAIARMDLLEMYVDFPPKLPNGQPDYASVTNNWWGDAVGVFRKPQKYSKLVRPVRVVNVWWANRVAGIDHVPVPAVRPRRRQIGREFSAAEHTNPPSSAPRP